MSAGAEWALAAGVTLAATALILLPGLLATAPLRLPLFARVALSGAFTVAFVGIAGIVAGALGLPLASWQLLLLAAMTGTGLWLIRRRRPAPLLVHDRSVNPAWLMLTWFAASIVIAVVAFGAVPSPERISQTYDNVFHLSSIGHILETGDASSLTLRTTIETGGAWGFYPAAWHSIVALTVQVTGSTAAVAVNAVWIAVAGAIWLPGVTWLAQVLLTRFDRDVVALVALPLGAAFGAMPYTLLTWGTLYPTFLATALLPTALAAPLSARLLYPRTARRESLPSWIAAVGTAAAVAAICVAQPRVLTTWALLLGPFAVAAIVGLYRRARKAGGRARRNALRALIVGFVVIAAIAGAAFAYLVLRLGLFDRPLDDRLGGPQARATQPVAEGLWQVLSQSWPTGVGHATTFPAVLLAVAVLVGIVAAARTRGMRWIVVAYVVVAVLFALAAGSDDVMTKLATALWYKDRYRLSSALPVLGVSLAALGILVAGRRLRRGRAVVMAAAAWTIALSSAIGIGAGGLSADVGFVFRLPARAADTEVLSQAQIDFMHRVGQTVPPDQRLLGDPWDGSALSMVYARREPIFPHVNGQWDPQRAVLAASLQDIEVNPAVCAALDGLRVRFVLYHPHEFGGGDPAGNLFAGVHTAVEAGLFTEVLSDGDSTLYRIDQCGELPL
ncbi:DUF6541 family protein [Microbacterium yannicii]|uniref:DUF6541 family protein n=1 Tax=Microbacterium yannicii TaxID=671622 RepID=UPI0002E20DA6|nr:DUF6541 family protein [Microbacterium yannicii]